MSVKFTSKGLADGTDSTKELEFNVAGVTTGTTRTITIPDGDTKLYTGDGTTGQVLTSNGAGTTPTFQAAAGGNLKIITEPTHNAAYTSSSGNWTTTGTGWSFTTGAETNRIAINLTYYAMTYDSNGGAPGGFASIWAHTSMTSGETPSGTEIVAGSADWFGGYNYDGSTARHDSYYDNSLHGVATVTANTTYYIQLVTKKGQYGDYVKTNRLRGYIMEYSQ